MALLAALVNVDRVDKFLLILVLLAVIGAFSSILLLAISFNVALVAYGTTLILFIVSL
jgi:hypothetical protein